MSDVAGGPATEWTTQAIQDVFLVIRAEKWDDVGEAIRRGLPLSATDSRGGLTLLHFAAGTYFIDLGAPVL